MANYYQLECSFWNDPDFESCSALGKLMYHYLGSNKYCNLIGFYRISVKRMKDDTNMTSPQVLAALQELTNLGKIAYDNAAQLVWIKAKLNRVKNRNLDTYFKGIYNEVMVLPYLPITDEFVRRYQKFLQEHLPGPKYTESDKHQLLAFLVKFLCDTHDIPMSSPSHTHLSNTNTNTLCIEIKDSDSDLELDLKAIPEPETIDETKRRALVASGIELYPDTPKAKFEAFRKAYPGTKRGAEVEWQNFSSKHNAAEVVDLLFPALNRRLAYQIECDAVGVFCPSWSNLQTYINQSRWTEEYGAVRSNKPNPFARPTRDQLQDTMDKALSELTGAPNEF